MGKISVYKQESRVANIAPGTKIPTIIKVKGHAGEVAGKCRLQALIAGGCFTDEQLCKMKNHQNAMTMIDWGGFSAQQSIIETKNECHLTSTQQCMIMGGRSYGGDFYGEKMSTSEKGKQMFKYVGNAKVHNDRKYDGVINGSKVVTCLMRPKDGYGFMTSGPLKLIRYTKADPQHNFLPTFDFEMTEVDEKSAAVIDAYVNRTRRR